MKGLLLQIFILVQTISLTLTDSLQSVDDSELTKLIKEEKYVITLFCTSSDQDKCDDYEAELTGVREDLIDVMEGDGWVVKVTDSGLIDQYYVGKPAGPLVIMFRSSLPVIYNGK